ncbi:MAG: TrkA family potassium uptake protein [Desulfobulbaceae bacterium]|jgi:trk system potassium uptake protein TrkA|nr:TrkA family potassium uptake protein [Desulfobulbaceae bacterium]
MKQDIAVIGLGLFGYEIAVCLEQKGHNVLAVDIIPEKIGAIKDQVTAAVVANITDESALRELDIDQFDMVILGLGKNLEELVLGITYLKKLGAQHIIARASSEIQEEILLRIGANEVILPEKQSADHLATRITVPNIMAFLKLDSDINLAEIHVDQKLAGKSLLELNLRKKHHITALILKRQDQQPKIITSPDTRLMLDDSVVVVGRQDDIERYFA